MNLPDYQTLMLPLLKATDDGNTHHVRELIDGMRLAELMIEFCLGVSTKETYQVKEMDTDYFEG